MLSLEDLIDISNLAATADIKVSQAIAVGGLVQRVDATIRTLAEQRQAAEQALAAVAAGKQQAADASPKTPPSKEIATAVAAAIAPAAQPGV